MDEGEWRVRFMRLVILTFLTCLSSGVNCVEILSMTGPVTVNSGNDVTLDCYYNYREEEQDQLDIKWYFNSSPTPIYQWLPAVSTGPQVIDKRFLEHLDLSYAVNTDKYEKHRALHLVNATHNFSGSYMCKVSSFLDEDFDQRDVYVIVPPQMVEITSELEEEERSGNISCTARGVYPTPQGKISWTQGSESHEEGEAVIRMNADGLADITISAQYQRSEEESTEVAILCQINIPNTDVVFTESSRLIFSLITLDESLSTEPLEEEQEGEWKQEEEEEQKEDDLGRFVIGFSNVTDAEDAINATFFDEDIIGSKSTEEEGHGLFDDVLYVPASDLGLVSLLLDVDNTTSADNDSELVDDFLIDNSDNLTTAAVLDEDKSSSEGGPEEEEVEVEAPGDFETNIELSLDAGERVSVGVPTCTCGLLVYATVLLHAIHRL